MLVIALPIALISLAWAATRFGADSRDGQDWQPREDYAGKERANYR